MPNETNANGFRGQLGHKEWPGRQSLMAWRFPGLCGLSNRGRHLELRFDPIGRPRRIRAVTIEWRGI
jgi:hypothetical protein